MEAQRTKLLQKDNDRLIDKILSMQNYTFYCHKQLSVELLRHNIAGAPEWFKAKVVEMRGHYGDIKGYERL